MDKTLDLTCYYCGRRATSGAYIDEDGIGWMAVCVDEECWDMASDDAFRQREARKHSESRTADCPLPTDRSDGK